MSVELAKACLTKKQYFVLEKIEHSSLYKIISNRLRNLQLYDIKILYTGL